MFKVHCMNNISKVGTNRLGDRYEFTSELADANAILVRSARLHDIELPKELLAIARAGAGVNNIAVLSRELWCLTLLEQMQMR